MSSTPSPGLPSSPLQSEKAKRYDRQLRLWGDHGQAALERASVCLVNAEAVGTEILKSLVLPGLGNFTILDPAMVRGEDAGNNFFLSSDSIGKSRGEVAVRLLLEMNHEVRGEARQESVDQVLNSDPDFFSRFQLVIVCGLPEKTLATISSICWQANIPLMAARSSGFLAYLRLQIKEHVVVEAHPESQAADLRLDQPWPALQQWLEEQAAAMPTMSLKDHGHTPYPVMLFAAMQNWRQGHGGSLPGNYKEKRALKEKMMEGMRKKEGNEEVWEDEENFEEAGRAVNTVVTATTVPSTTREILDDPAADTISATSSSFWVLAHALREFVNREGRLPVSGAVPDMFSDSERYIQLQGIYKEKAREDMEQVGRKVAQVLESLGRSAETIQEAEVRRFCKESRNLRVQRGSNISEEFNQPSNGEWCDPDLGSDRLYYLALRAVDRYHDQWGADPGLTESDIEVDIGRLKTIAASLLSGLGLNSNPQGIDEHVHEVCRYGGACLHSVAAFLGGSAAHEGVKILTGQFVPIHNTVVYNAVTGAVSHFLV